MKTVFYSTVAAVALSAGMASAEAPKMGEGAFNWESLNAFKSLDLSGQTISIAESMVAGTLSNEAQRLGWVVVSPAAPDGERFFDGSEVLVPGLLDWVDMWVDVEGDAPHVAGISNGGLSSFRYAALNPDRVQSVTAFPGFPRNSDDRAALTDFADVPIRLFVGGTDTNWIGPAEQTVTEFEELGGDVELTIFPGEGHIMDSTRDGTVVFEQLEDFRVQ